MAYVLHVLVLILDVFAVFEPVIPLFNYDVSFADKHILLQFSKKCNSVVSVFVFATNFRKKENKII